MALLHDDLVAIFWFCFSLKQKIEKTANDAKMRQPCFIAAAGGSQNTKPFISKKTCRHFFAGKQVFIAALFRDDTMF
jgi:hypothetical protein